MKKLTRFMWQQVSLVCCNFSLILYKINGILFSCDLHAGLAAAHIWSLDREAGLGCAVTGRGPGAGLGKTGLPGARVVGSGRRGSFTNLQIIQMLNHWQYYFI